MSKLSKEDLIKKVSEKVSDENIQIELMEDISDSFEVDSDSISQEEFEKLTNDYNDLKEKYKSRFLEAKEVKEEKDDKEKEDKEELEEEKYVDVKDI